MKNKTPINITRCRPIEIDSPQFSGIDPQSDKSHRRVKWVYRGFVQTIPTNRYNPSKIFSVVFRATPFQFHPVIWFSHIPNDSISGERGYRHIYRAYYAPISKSGSPSFALPL